MKSPDALKRLVMLRNKADGETELLKGGTGQLQTAKRQSIAKEPRSETAER
jgi:hypothetical protein